MKAYFSKRTWEMYVWEGMNGKSEETDKELHWIPTKLNFNTGRSLKISGFPLSSLFCCSHQIKKINSELLCMRIGGGKGEQEGSRKIFSQAGLNDSAQVFSAHSSSAHVFP